MITWGISSESHNAALAVFADDSLLFASESERFSRIKNDPIIPDNLIHHALQYGKPDLVCWYERPFIKQLRQLRAGQGLKENFTEYIDAPVKFYGHHYTHACGGYYTSNFRNACIVVIDAIGEFQTLTIWEAVNDDITLKYQKRYPNSIGLWYSAMTQRCGLKPNEEEYILMAMSALGDPAKLRQVMFDDFIDEDFKFKKNLHKGCKDWRPEENIHDIAAATQDVYEILFELILRKAKRLVGSDNLVLMGGCALNCAANPKAYSFFKNVWIMPAPGDNGSAIGAVLAHKKKHITYTPYTGVNITSKYDNGVIVDHLLDNKVCGIARGRAEFGPRALGNRSLLADPRDLGIKDKVNGIKGRESFRPFAPVILEEYAKVYFNLPVKRSPYMQFTAMCNFPDKYPGIVHVDGTSRVQTVTMRDNKPLYNLLRLWKNKTGCPMLLNTSLNVKGEPMVNDIDDAKRFATVNNVKVFT